MIRPAFIIALAAGAFAIARPVQAENAACGGDDARQDISCTAITEKLMLSLRGQDEAAVRKVMKAPGRTIEGGVHFLSNYSRGRQDGSGDLNVIFENRRAVSIFAAVDKANGSGTQNFIWSAYAAPSLGQEIDRASADFARRPFCSDLSSKPARCSTNVGMDGELTKLQMQGNLSKADLFKGLEGACTPRQGLAVSDPAGDCDRLRRQLR
ncbi:MAG: hypothetical protein ACRYG8_02295 [Janthinobacterium lividum]